MLKDSIDFSLPLTTSHAYTVIRKNEIGKTQKSDELANSRSKKLRRTFDEIMNTVTPELANGRNKEANTWQTLLASFFGKHPRTPPCFWKMATEKPLGKLL